MKKLFWVMFALMISSIAMAAGGGEHGHDEIPWGTIQKQAINFAVVFGGLIFILKSKVGEFFKSRVESFEKLAVLAKKAKEDAENQRHDINTRLQKLETTAAESIERATKEAQELRAKIEAEAKALAQQIKNDAKASLDREIEKAKTELRDEVLAQSMKHTREQLKTSVKDADQTRLQNEFVQKIQVVR